MMGFTNRAILVYFKEEENQTLEDHVRKAAGGKKKIKTVSLEKEINIWVLLETVLLFPILSNP